MKSISVKNAVFICILGLVTVLLSLYGCGEGGGEANGDDENTPTTNPDLVVESPSVSDSTPTAGGNFTLSATVRNGRGWSFGGHDATLLPVNRRDDHNIRHGGGHRRRDRAFDFGKRQRVSGSYSTFKSWDILLRRVRGRGDRRV